MSEVVLAFARRDMSQGRPEIRPERFTRPGGGPAGQGFELSKHLFDRIEIGTIGWQKPQRRSYPLNGLGTERVLMDGEVIQDDEVTRV